MKDHRIKSDRSTIAKALEGDYRPEHLFVLRQNLELYDSHRSMIATCDAEIRQYLAGLDSQIDLAAKPLPEHKSSHRKPQRNEPSFDLRSELYRLSGVDFTAIDGFDALTTQTILSEVGLDPSRFPSEKHFASWLALCPNNRVTGGRIINSRTRKVINRAANALRLAAQAAGNSASALGAYYRRMRAKFGAPKAITATAHKLARIFYRLWKYGEDYQDPGVESYELKYRERVLRSLNARATDLGFTLVPLQTVTSSVS